MIDDVARNEMQAHRLPGVSVAFFLGDKLAHEAVFGTASLGDAGCVRSETRFLLNCSTKPLTALALQHLSTRGLLSLDAPVASLVPKFRPRSPDRLVRQVRVRDLLAHSSGLARGAYHCRHRGDEEYFDEINGSPLIETPRVSGKYSNLGFFLAGAVAERVSGMPFAEFMESRILARAGATDIGFWSPGGDCATGYEGFHRFAPPQFDEPLREARMLPLPLAAGGLWATAAGLARLLLAVFAGPDKLLGPGHAARLLERATTRGGEGVCGSEFGFRIGRRLGLPAVYQTGSGSGFSSVVIYLPARRLGAVALTNRSWASPSLNRIVDAGFCALCPQLRDQLRDPLAGSAPGVYHGEDGSLMIRRHVDGLRALFPDGSARLLPRGNSRFEVTEGPRSRYLLECGAGKRRYCCSGPHVWRRKFQGRKPHDDAWSKFLGTYHYDDIGWAEVFVRFGKPGLQLGPLFYTPLEPDGDDAFRQVRGRFAGERVRFMGGRDGAADAFEMAGMRFDRRHEHVFARPGGARQCGSLSQNP